MWHMVTRGQLYEEVWSMPLSQLCERYGLSDNGLRKVCRRLSVPVPPRGYWAKVEARLAEVDPSTAEDVRWRWARVFARGAR